MEKGAGELGFVPEVSFCHNGLSEHDNSLLSYLYMMLVTCSKRS
jgi:hypothetical protein